MRWAPAPQRREQMALFASRLDDAIPADHPVRLLDEILASPEIRWSGWEAVYHGRLGQPPIHPGVLVRVLLYGLLMRIRSSRGLEEALQMRMDFRWLAEGRSIDHTTLSEFRRKHKQQLRTLFVQIGRVARRLGLLGLTQVAYDGTRVRANNRRSGTRTRDELLREQAELQARFDELMAQAESADAHDDERFAAGSSRALPGDLAQVRQRRKRINRALREFARLEGAGETLPRRLPLTDPEARVMPNKEGGFAPNYTPTATVDVASGVILEARVLAVHNEDQHLLPALQQVQQDFGLAAPPPEALADGLIGTGANLAGAAAAGVTLYSPCEIPDPAKNPALRPDPTQAVPAADWERLPVKKVGNGQATQIDKSAFVYDAERKCYWCPLGQALSHQGTTTEASGTGRRIRERYQADARACAECPLRARCVTGKAASRQINREQYEAHREHHAARMATAEAQQKYALRRHVGERPFAMIKQRFGLRQFLLRGLENVQAEWHWATSAFNLHTIISWRTRAGPKGHPTVVPSGAHY